MNRRFLFGLMIFLQPLVLLASGFMVPEQGTANMTTGNAGAAVDLDPTANWFNPAILTKLPGTQVSTGFVYIDIYNKYTGLAPQFADHEPNNDPVMVPFFYASHRIHETMAVGLGVNTPFGLIQDWGNVWTGRRIVTRASLRATFINPNLALQLPSSLTRQMGGLSISWAIGLDLGFGRFRLSRRIDQSGVGAPDGYLKIIGGGSKDGIDFGDDILGISFNTALFLEWKWFSFGVSYRHKTGFYAKHSDAARAKFYNIHPVYQAAGLVDQYTNTRLVLPSLLMLGWKVRYWKIELIFDAWWTDWTTYDTLTFYFRQLPTSVSEKDWNSSWAFRGGIRYYVLGAPVLKHKDGMASWHVPKRQMYVAIGTFYDNTPVPDWTFEPTLPDSDRYGLTFGGGLKWDNFGADMAFLFLFADDRYKNNLIGSSSGTLSDPYTANGKYTVDAFLFSFSVYMRF